MVRGKGIVDEIDDLEDVKKDEWETKKDVEEGNEKELKKQKKILDNISEEISVFDYDEEM